MNKKSLILAISLVLIVFLSLSMVSAEDISDDDNTDSDILQVEDADAVTASEVTVETTDTNDDIQNKINGLNDGDTLTFQTGEYTDIILYVNKSITINGNGATLHGLNNLVSADNRIPDIILNKTTDGGYGISNPATLYILGTNNLVLKDITIIAGQNSATDKGDATKYSNCLVYNYKSTNTQITNSTFDGSSWGIYFFQSTGGLIEKNIVKNQGITGIFNFQTPNTIIRNNTVINAKNHGIDVRHNIGPNVTVVNNKIVGAKEGLYLLHSGKHTVTGNTIINCSESSITCCGANNILIENNTFQNSRIGVLLAGSAPSGGNYVPYTNITIGTNTWKLDQLPFPPTFTCYVAEAKSDYASVDTMMGTHSDSLYGDTYTEYTEIPALGPIVVDYDTLLRPTSTNKTITAGMTNEQIQETINSMNNGDTLLFEENAVFENICIYINKNIKVIGNNATLKGVASVSYDYVPEIVTNKTTQGGYAIPNIAVLYVLNTTGAVISNLNIVANYPKYTMPCQAGDNDNYRAYYSTGIYGGLSKKLTITGCSITGASWGIFLGGRPDGDYKYGCQNATITNNIIKNQYTTGIMNFASPNSIIANNTVTNAVNHGIDVRFPAGFGAKIFNNTISGSKEGIYLLHSYGHYVYNNTILNSKISSITCYGSHDEYIFNNTFTKSRVAILLGGSAGTSYYNVTIGKNYFTGDVLPFPPTFAFTLVKSENQYNDASAVMRTYSDKEIVTISAPDITFDVNEEGILTITLIDQNNKAMAGKTISVTVNNGNYTATTDANGIATIPLNLPEGTYPAEISFAGNDNYKPAKVNSTITAKKVNTELTAANPTVYVQAIAKGLKYQVTLKDASGKAIAGKQIVVNFNGVDYKANTNAQGIATVTLKATKAGSLKAEIKFAGDNTYNAASKTTTVKITKEASKLTAKKKTFKANKKVKKYAVTLKTKSGKAISNAKVTLKIKNKKFTATTNSKGKATFKIKKLTKKGKPKAKISFAGDKYFIKSSATVKLTFKK
ncbi:NosD domain-containing protein [Methanobrevibacter sp.]|uniref:NosD domain-containing protein n=1 Tax=Methanobrevibacter sp. TaxID=66852 RepID=UPI002600A8E6|nr:NosD domain-containing protein [Methanobrevibacter sp.]MBR4447045.1 Ig-like domain-containing protein [Methanobrevibacter sp.]